MTDLKQHINYPDLNETGKKKVQRAFHENDLNYLASFAIESKSITNLDLEDLNERIEKRSGNSFLNGTVFIAVLCGVFIGLSIFFVIYENSKIHDSHYQALNQPLLNKNNLAPETVVETPNENKAKSEYHQEHFSIHNSGEQITNLEVGENMNIKEINELEVPVTPKNEEPVLDYIPNAPIIFIKDLKVANYKLYYFKNERSIDISDNGVSAQFENKTEVINNLQSKLNERNYYAHEIIKDALVNFNSKNYTTCISQFELLLNYNKADVNAQFYLGMSYFYLGNYYKAQNFLDEVLSNSINVFQQESEFYKALCLRVNKKEGEAKELLISIAAKKMFYSERAKQELEKFK